MILANVFVQIIIVLVVVLLFIITFILNNKIKAKNNNENNELLEKCSGCNIQSCILRNKDLKDIKKNLKEIINSCEEEKK